MPIYDDNGNEIDTSKIEVPDLCKSCEKYDDPNEEILCNLNRFDQQEDDDFQCYAYENMYGALDAGIVE